MPKINTGRWLAGGIVAGVLVNVSETILNTVVLKKPWDEVMKSLGKASVMTTQAICVWVIWGFVYGLLCVWLYAGIRPRFGAGPGTAFKAGFVAWMLTNLLSSIGMANMGIFPMNLLTITAIWTLVESIVVTMIGAWIYKEA